MKQYLLPLLFALLFFFQGLLSGLQKSLTWDEPVFIASGYTYLAKNDFRLNPEAPPLMQQLEALPLLLLNLDIPGTDEPAWQQGNHFRYARTFFLKNITQTQAIAFRARLPVLLLGVGLILVIAAWTRRLYGPIPALVATTAATFCPNLIAHSRLATTDFGCAALMFFSVYTFWKCTQTPTPKNWILCGLVTGLALLSKYTALLLGPTYLILAFLHLGRDRSHLSAFLKGAAIITGVVLIILGAGYNLSFNPLLYFQGLQKVYATATPGYLFYLFGHLSEQPLWYYNLAAFFVKVPLPLLLLLALAIVQAIRNPQHCTLYLLLPTIIILAASCFDKANLGLRRILPAFPFLLAFTAQSLNLENAAESRYSHILPWLITILLAWTAIETLRIYPHHLSYFNQAAGGPERGPYLLDDSNIDWGQDLPALAAWQKNNPHPLKLRYFGNIYPAAYGVQAEFMPDQDIADPRPGFYAISAHNLVYFRKLKKRTGRNLDWLTRYRPVARAGYSIYIYQFP